MWQSQPFVVAVTFFLSLPILLNRMSRHGRGVAPIRVGHVALPVGGSLTWEHGHFLEVCGVLCCPQRLIAPWDSRFTQGRCARRVVSAATDADAMTLGANQTTGHRLSGPTRGVGLQGADSPDCPDCPTNPQTNIEWNGEPITSHA